jgi:hypothetical protein
MNIGNVQISIQVNPETIWSKDKRMKCSPFQIFSASQDRSVGKGCFPIAARHGVGGLELLFKAGLELTASFGD